MSFEDVPVRIHIPRETEVPAEPREIPSEEPVQVPAEPEKVPVGADQALNF